MKKTFFTSALALLVFLTGFQTVATGSVIVDRVIAVVNEEIITLSDLQREALQKKVESKDERLLLEDMIDRKLQMAAAKRAGMDVTDKELTDALADIMKRNSMDLKQFEAALAKEGLSIEQYKRELREQMTLSRMFNKFVRSGVIVDEAEVRSYYERNSASYTMPEEIRVRQIFFRLPDKAGPAETARVRDKAMAALARAKKGENFEALVKELSENENAALGGDLGFVQRSELTPEIEQAVQNRKPGEIAGPVLFAGGFHIFRIEEIRTPVNSYEKVKNEITKKLYDEKMENTYRSWLQTLRSDSNIENRL